MSATAAAIATDGFAVVPGVLERAGVNRAIAALDDVFAAEDDIAAEREWRTAAYRVAYLLPAKHPVFLELCRPGPLVSAAAEVLGPDLVFGGFNGMSMVPGGQPQPLHRDHTDLTPGSTLYVHAVVALDRFTAANGATRIVPRSHLEPGDDHDEADARPIELAAGDAVLFDATCVHAGSANTTTQPRRALHVLFCRRWVQPHWDLPAGLRPADVATLDGPRRALLGFDRVPFRWDHVSRTRSRAW